MFGYFKKRKNNRIIRFRDVLSAEHGAKSNYSKDEIESSLQKNIDLEKYSKEIFAYYMSAALYMNSFPQKSEAAWVEIQTEIKNHLSDSIKSYSTTDNLGHNNGHEHSNHNPNHTVSSDYD